MASLLHYSLTPSVHHSSSPLIPLMPPIYLFLQSITSHHCMLLFSICLLDLALIQSRTSPPLHSAPLLHSFAVGRSQMFIFLCIFCVERRNLHPKWSNIFTREIISEQLFILNFYTRNWHLSSGCLCFLESEDVLCSLSWCWSRVGGGETAALREDGVHLQQPPLHPHAAPVWPL